MRPPSLAAATALLAAAAATGQARVVVGSKNFTESGVLAELMAQVIEARTGLAVERRTNLGGTSICWAALREGEIDLYAEYTGTAWAVVLGETGRVADPLQTFLHVRRRCASEHGVAWLDPFGLDNTYALAMRETQAAALGITRISDLAQHPGRLRAGFSIEFTSRNDGWPGLAPTYGLAFAEVRALEHGLAYAAIRAGEVDVIDAYSTDGKLLRYGLRVLDDDRRFFPPYQAAPVVREEALRAHPELADSLALLAFRVPDRVVQALNFLVEGESHGFAAVARAFLEHERLVPTVDPAAAAARVRLEQILRGPPAPAADRSAATPARSAAPAARAGPTRETLRRTAQHLALTLAAVVLAAGVAIPLGILGTTRRRLRQVLLAAAGVLQTVPSLALLAFMIPLLGLGAEAAVAALFLYALLPILRNTYTGIVEVDRDVVEAARGMGMRPRQILWHVQLPLASRTIMAGIRTATVISIGVATLAAFVGAGGLGEPIVSGLYLDDTGLILAGAIPAAALAVAADQALGWVERRLQRRSGAVG